MLAFNDSSTKRWTGISLWTGAANPVFRVKGMLYSANSGSELARSLYAGDFSRLRCIYGEPWNRVSAELTSCSRMRSLTDDNTVLAVASSMEKRPFISPLTKGRPIKQSRPLDRLLEVLDMSAGQPQETGCRCHYR